MMKLWKKHFTLAGLPANQTSVSAESFYLLMSKRNPKNKWSKLNKQRVQKLMQNEDMAPAGIAIVEEAKRSGTWHALDEVEALISLLT